LLGRSERGADGIAKAKIHRRQIALDKGCKREYLYITSKARGAWEDVRG
jgi:hypothetical protein